MPHALPHGHPHTLDWFLMGDGAISSLFHSVRGLPEPQVHMARLVH